MMAPKRSPRIALALDRQAHRLVMPFTAWSTYALIPVGIIVILSAFIPLEINPRLFSQAKPLQISGPEAPPTSLWFAVAPTKEGISISTTDGKSFELKNDEREKERGEAFREYLSERKKELIKEKTLANRVDDQSTLVVLSADERLTYFHLRPVIYALASAGVTRYAFEGRIGKESDGSQ